MEPVTDHAAALPPGHARSGRTSYEETRGSRQHHIAIGRRELVKEINAEKKNYWMTLLISPYEYPPDYMFLGH